MTDIQETLSFCITCKNRFWQICQTLPQNLKNNAGAKDRIEFVLVDFGSTDGLYDWIKGNFLREMEEGYLKYYYTDNLPYWHASVCKNTAHMLAQNTILVNLDCDNYTGPEGGLFVIDKFRRHGVDQAVIHQFNGIPFSGCYGRIAVSKQNFLRAGGYDESFGPMAFQDCDLITRLNLMGLSYFMYEDATFNHAIANTKEEGLKNAKSQLKWEEMLINNKRISWNNLKKGRYTANCSQETIGITRGIRSFFELGPNGPH